MGATQKRLESPGRVITGVEGVCGGIKFAQ